MGMYDTNPDPRVDGYPDGGSDGPDKQEQAEYDFWNEKSKYPRGYGPPYRGEDMPSDTGDPFHVDEEAPDPNLIHHPGFPEATHDDYAGHYDDYDHALGDQEHQEGYEEPGGKIGAILTQAQQWPNRVAANKPPVGGDVHRMRGRDTGLYGTDEDDLYDVYARPSPTHGPKAYDVIRPATQQ